MELAREELKKALDSTVIRNATIPVYTNVTAEPVTAASSIRDLLLEQVTSPVRWEQSIKNMVRDGATAFMEIGPGKVLQGLVRRIEADVMVSGVDTYADLKQPAT
jgi:[acyl-carrier-protein] S-malonyltransferase